MLAHLLLIALQTINAPYDIVVKVNNTDPIPPPLPVTDLGDLGMHISGRFAYYAPAPITESGGWPTEHWSLTLACADNAPWSTSPPYTGRIYDVLVEGQRVAMYPLLDVLTADGLPLKDPVLATAAELQPRFDVQIGPLGGGQRLESGPCDVHIIPVCGGVACAIGWPPTADVRVRWRWLSDTDLDSLQCAPDDALDRVRGCVKHGVIRGTLVSCAVCTCQPGTTHVVSCP